jgi:hypothetical protein
MRASGDHELIRRAAVGSYLESDKAERNLYGKTHLSHIFYCWKCFSGEQSIVT